MCEGGKHVPLQASGLLMNSVESTDFDPYIKLSHVWGLLLSWGLVLQFATVATLQMALQVITAGCLFSFYSTCGSEPRKAT